MLHVTSLPGKWGIGTLGSEAFEFVDWLSSTGASVWQVLPLSPPVYANSPYQALSSFAGNPLIISPEKLYSDGFITSKELFSAQLENSSKVTWRQLNTRASLLKLAASRAVMENIKEFTIFAGVPWVKRWSIFSAMKENNGGKPWIKWKNHSPPQNQQVLQNSMIQYFFQKQWDDLKVHSFSKGVKILGDIPIYTAHDSSDVYFNRNLFKLNSDGSPNCVAGVPPDYFSKTGQLWGNPVYDWEENKLTGYQWWTSRLERALNLYDAIRIDHFRGFDEYWEIPSLERTAVNGHWQKGPGPDLFKKMQEKLGVMPIIAEDLGLITESVLKLREDCGYPGMTVLQFALQDSSFSKESIQESSVVYTGTHDNDTTQGWIDRIGKKLGIKDVDFLISAALTSNACLAIIPMQDILKLGTSARMNEPGTSRGNWSWRLKELAYPDVSLKRT